VIRKIATCRERQRTNKWDSEVLERALRDFQAGSQGTVMGTALTWMGANAHTRAISSTRGKWKKKVPDGNDPDRDRADPLCNKALRILTSAASNLLLNKT